MVKSTNIMQTLMIEKTVFEKYFSQLFPFAYNILGNTMAAEDVVQDVLIKFSSIETSEIENQDAFLVRSVINRAINQKQLIREQREVYPGNWLPEPVLTEDTMFANMDTSQILSYSLLVLLEKLNAKERAIFILKESYEYSHAEIAEILHITIENARQSLKRAKEKLKVSHIQLKRPLQNQSLVNELVKAIENRDMDAIVALLAEDACITSDGGGIVSAARKPVTGTDSVMKFLMSIWNKYMLDNTMVEYKLINHQSTLVFSLGGKVYRTITFSINTDGRIDDIFVQINPEKLTKF